MGETISEPVSQVGENSESLGEEISPKDLPFDERVLRLKEMLKDDDVFRQCIAEVYIYISMLDEMMRAVQAQGGPMRIVAAMLKGKKNE